MTAAAFLAPELGAGQRPRGPPRIDAGAEQSLARLDVADPGQQRLIEDHHLDRQSRAREPARQPVDVDAVRERIRPERRDVRQRIEAGAGDDAEAPEQAQVRVVQARAVIEIDAHAREPRAGVAGPPVQPLPGHPEMRPNADRRAAR